MNTEHADLRVEGNELEVAGHRWRVHFPIVEARVLDDRVVVLYDNMSGPKHQQFRNVEGFDLLGQSLWVAEHPRNASNDSYVSFQSTVPLRLGNFAGFECELEPSSGHIIHARFTK